MSDRHARGGEGSLLPAKERVSQLYIHFNSLFIWLGRVERGGGVDKRHHGRGRENLMILCLNPGFPSSPAWENRVRIPNLHSFFLKWRTNTFTTQC